MMKINGRAISGPNIEYIVLPRGNGEDIVFTAKAVLDLSRFENLVAEPKPDKMTLPGGIIKEDVDGKAYKIAMDQFNAKRYAFIMIESLRESEIEWDTVDYDKPETWSNWQTDLKNAGFANSEVHAITMGVASANGLNQDKIEQARSRFLASRILHPSV